jgi:hypothetical protein
MIENVKKPSSPAATISNVGAWAMNIVSSVGIIMANKQLMSNNGYVFTFGRLPNSLNYLDLLFFISISLSHIIFFSFSQHVNWVPFCCYCSRRYTLKCYRLLNIIKACPYVGASLVLNGCQFVYHWHEF